MDAGFAHDLEKFAGGLDGLEGVGFLLHGDAAVASLAAVFDLVEGVDEQAEFSGGVDVLGVEVGVGVLEGGDGVDEQVGGEGFDDLGSVGLEVSDVAGGGGVGAVHALADLSVGESLAAECCGPGVVWLVGRGSWGFLTLVRTVLCRSYGVCVGLAAAGDPLCHFVTSPASSAGQASPAERGRKFGGAIQEGYEEEGAGSGSGAGSGEGTGLGHE